MTELAEKVVKHKRPRIEHYDDPLSVGIRLFNAREKANLSQRELAFPGCSAAYISRIERGERVPSLQTMEQLARRTGISAHYLAWGKEILDPKVAAAISRANKAALGNLADLADAYKALGRAAKAAAKVLEES